MFNPLISYPTVVNTVGVFRVTKLPLSKSISWPSSYSIPSGDNVGVCFPRIPNNSIPSCSLVHLTAPPSPSW